MNKPTFTDIVIGELEEMGKTFISQGVILLNRVWELNGIQKRTTITDELKNKFRQEDFHWVGLMGMEDFIEEAKRVKNTTSSTQMYAIAEKIIQLAENNDK